MRSIGRQTLDVETKSPDIGMLPAGGRGSPGETQKHKVPAGVPGCRCQRHVPLQKHPSVRTCGPRSTLSPEAQVVYFPVTSG